MSSAYAKFIAEAAYKHSIDKPNTSSDLAFYEEAGRIAHRVDLDSIWVDAEYIPVKAPEVDDDGVYKVTLDSGVTREVLLKVENLQLTRVPNTRASFKEINPPTLRHNLKDTIFPNYGDNYSIILIDDAGDVIPFGLNKWVVDPDNGQLSFLEGLPTGYAEPFYISFYKYIGKKANEGILLSNGSVPLDDGYKPSNPNDIATKGYIDSIKRVTEETINKLIPTLPGSFNNKDLELVKLDNGNFIPPIKGCLYYDNTKVPIAIYKNSDGEDILNTYRIKIPRFHLPEGKSYLKFFINNEYIATPVCLNSEEPPLGGDSHNISDLFSWDIIRCVDPYDKDLVACGFYKSIDSEITLKPGIVPSRFLDINTSGVVSLRIQLETKVTETDILAATNDFKFGIEDLTKIVPYITEPKWSQPKNVDPKLPIEPYYISGVPSLKKDSIISLNFNIANIFRFRPDILGSVSVENLYSSLLPTWAIESGDKRALSYMQDIPIKENIFLEKLDCYITSTGIDEKQNLNRKDSFNIRIDTVSDESKRSISPSKPEDFLGTHFIASTWTESKASEDLHKNNELQLLNGLYQWPTGDYTANGLKDENNRILGIPSGPDYTDIIDGVRYVTFSILIDDILGENKAVNGFWIKLLNAENVEVDNDTHIYTNITEFKCLIEDRYTVQDIEGTPWLDMNMPYEGTLSPNKLNQGCLVVSSSTNDTKYITFGSHPRKGKLDILIGLNKASNIKFSGVEIVFKA